MKLFEVCAMNLFYDLTICVLLASQEKYVLGANGVALASVSALVSFAWTKTLTLAVH